MRLSVKAIILVIVGLSVVGASLLFNEKQKRKKAEDELALQTARTLTEIFQGKSALKVAEITGKANSGQVTTSSAGGIFHPTLNVSAPYKVQYFVNLQSIDRSDYRWDSETATMFIKVPEITVEDPAIDFSKAEMKFGGVFVSRDASARLQKEGGRRMIVASTKTARRDDNLAKARREARDAISNFVAGPLRAAGRGDVSVKVQFPFEDRPEGVDDERWDMSRTIEEVMADINR